MAVRTTTQFKALYGTSGSLFPDNTSGDISEADVRAFGEDIADSFLNESDDPYTGPFPQVTASGTDTYAATTSPAISAYATGQKFQIKFTNASTGVSTLNLNTLGAKKIYTNPTTQATTGDITAAQIYLLIYDAALDTAAGGFLMIGGSGGSGGATDAEDVTFTPAGNISATDVQAALEELDTDKATTGSVSTVATDLSNHISDATDAHDASAISFSATGNIAATDVQAAIEELDTEKAPIDRTESWEVPFGDESSPITATTAKLTFYWPYDNTTLSAIWAGLTVVQTSGSTFTIDVNKNGTTMLSTKITIDNTEDTSLTAATQPVLSTTTLSRGDKIVIDVDQVGDATAKGPKIIFDFTRF